MFLCYFIWASYQPGDEDIILDSALFLGIEPPRAELDWSLHPNPTAGEIWIQADEKIQVGGSLRVFNMLGEVVMQEGFPTVVSGAFRMDLGSLKSGLYQVEIRTSGGRSVHKVMRW